jgi:hypothetical protein
VVRCCRQVLLTEQDPDGGDVDAALSRGRVAKLCRSSRTLTRLVEPSVAAAERQAACNTVSSIWLSGARPESETEGAGSAANSCAECRAALPKASRSAPWDRTSGALFSYVDVEARIRAKHPLRAMRPLTNGALVRLGLAAHRRPL